MRLHVVVVIALCSCGKGAKDAPAPAPGSAVGGSAVASPAAGSGSAVAVVSALSPKLEAAKCGEPCLFLLDTPIAQLADTYKTRCGGMETKNLGFDDCKQLDYVRNCVYAAHGVVYKKKKWKQVFDAKPWYEPHAEVTAKTIAMSEVEHANVHELYLRGKACKKNLKISGADYERIKAWFAALPKPPMPKFTFAWNNFGAQEEPTELPVVDRKGLVTFLDDKNTELKHMVLSAKDVVGSYEDPATFAKQTKLLEAIHVTDSSKLRSIILEIELGHGTEDEPYTDSMTLRFVYDDKDQLVAFTGEHIAFD
jgi:hypothetical protein